MVKQKDQRDRKENTVPGGAKALKRWGPEPQGWQKTGHTGTGAQPVHYQN